MSDSIYFSSKDLVWLSGEIKTPPFSLRARWEAGKALRALQWGVQLSLPVSRPMPTVGPRCHELRVQDKNVSWRIIYSIEADAIVILDIFAKKTQTTPHHIIEACKHRLRRYHDIIEESSHAPRQT